jgi:DNA polymerase-3 subunit alpha
MKRWKQCSPLADKENLVHLNTRSDMSLLEGAATMDKFCELAASRGNPAISFTEAGSVRGCVEFAVMARRAEIKPIFGVTVYVCGDMKRRGLTVEERAAVTAGLRPSEYADAIRVYEEKHGIMDRDPLTVWAQTQEGLANLFQLTSKSWVEGFYYTPRVDLKTLFEHSEGLMIGTGEMDSIIHRRAINGQRKRAVEMSDWLWEVFGPDRFWVELQPHPIYEQAEANEFALHLLKRYSGARALATQGARYLHRGDDKYQRMLAAIGDHKDKSLEECGLPGDSYWLKTRDEMRESFHDYHSALGDHLIKQALDNTLAFNEMCSVVIEPDRFTFDLVNVYTPPELNNDENAYIRQLCLEGWTWRDMPKRIRDYAARFGMSEREAIDLYKKRLKYELAALERQKFTKYILMVRELYAWVRAQKIACGPGRGSAGGSLVNFLLGITSVDPVDNALLFERFINPDRIDMPDIDMDFEDARRYEVIEHLKEKYGHDCVSQIATWGTLKGKACIKDVSRVLGIPMGEVSLVTNAVLERSSGDERASMTVMDSFDQFTVCKEFDKKYPEVRKYCEHLEGLAKNLGTHAAGVICAPRRLMDVCPLETRKDPHGDGRIIVTAPPMSGAASLGLLKLDCLGLRTMTIIRMAQEEVQRRHGNWVDLEQVDVNDPFVLQGFTDHSYIGVFQYDSVSADKICRGVVFEKFEDVVAMTALNRPGTSRSGLATQYVARKKNPDLVKETSMHPAVSKITEDTLGIIVYQEHVVKIFMEVAGFHPGHADSLRKKISKRWGNETLGKEREKFIEGAMKNTPGMTKKIAGKIMDAITFFGSYGFNKSHATSYGMIAYWCMYMKRRHPLEFYLGNLKCQSDHRKLQSIIKDARKNGVTVLPPDVSKSGVEFSIDDDANAIRGSLVDIKGVGHKAAASIMAEAPYTGLWDFLSRVNRSAVNKGVVKSLALAGALDNMIPNLKFFIERFDKLWEEIKKAGQVDKASGKWVWKEERRSALASILERSASMPTYGSEERTLIASKVNPLAFGKHPIDAYSDFMKRHCKHKITSMGREDFFQRNDFKKKGGIWIAGIIVAIKLNQVGDFHNGEEPDAQAKERMGWGKRYANVNIEDSSGEQHRCKIDWDIYDAHWHLIDSGVGTPVIAHVSVNGQYENLRAHFVINLEEYRKRIEAKAELNIWERIINGQHPSLVREWKNEKLQALALQDVEKLKKRAQGLAAKTKDGVSIQVAGVVTNVRQKPDKRNNLMGFFGLLAPTGFIDCLCFASNWKGIKGAVKVGNLISITLEYSRGSAIYDGGRIRLIEGSALKQARK